MPRRSRAREVALQLLFQQDHNRTVPRDEIQRFVQERLRDENLQQFCITLFDGVMQQRAQLDQHISNAAENWRVARMSTVDRNVLRLGGYELMHMPDSPARVVLDEAITLARRYGSADSPAFVNGVLDRLLRDLQGQ